MESMFTAEFFAGNRKRLRQLFTGTAPIILTANGLIQRNNDQTLPFRQDSNFWYLTGIDKPDLILVMDKTKEYLILPEGSDYLSSFIGETANDEYTQRSGIETILSHKEGWRTLKSRLSRVSHIATLSPAPKYIPDYGMYTNPARAYLLEQIKAIKDDIEPLDLRQHMAKLRVVKQAPELAAIEKAIALTIDCLKQTERKIQNAKYETEYQVAADITHYFQWRGYVDAWDPLVMVGPNATVIHHEKDGTKLEPGQFITLDIGVEVEHYASDITRTYPIGEVSKRHQEAYEAVLAVHAYAMSICKPGVSIRDNEKLVEQFMGEKLRELGLIKTIDRENVRTYFGHATSHYLGLDVHDVGDYDQPLEPGMVLTIEPGIYIAKEGIGIRIEDDVLVTEDGIKVLTDKLPRDFPVKS